MTATLTVLGSCGAWPEAGKACSGFLVDVDGFRVVLDLGYGTASRLFAALGSSAGAGVDAIVISHRHPDHMADLHALFRARWFGDRGSSPLPVYAAAGVRERLLAMEEPEDIGDVDAVFAFHPLPGAYQVGPLALTAVDLPHYVPNAGVRIESGSFALAYTGDCGLVDALVQLAAGADVLLAEASDRTQQSTTPPPTEHGSHLSGADAGRVAARAGVGRLVLTHFWPGNDRESTRAAAANHFPGPVDNAEEGLVMSLG